MKKRSIRKISLEKNIQIKNVEKSKFSRIQKTEVGKPHFRHPNKKPIINIDPTASYKGDKKIAIIFHSFYYDETLGIIENFIKLKKNLSFDLYVSISKNGESDKEDVINLFKKNLDATVFKYSNVSKDIIPKWKIIKHLCKNEKEYDYVFLYHDKKSKQYLKEPKCHWMSTWHRELALPLFDKTYRDNALSIFDYNETIGGIGIGKHLHFGPGWHKEMTRRRYTNESELLKFQSELTNKLKIRNLHQCWFIGGTMFWVRFNILKDFINRYDINNLISLTANDKGDVRDPSMTHTLERFFGHIIQLSGYKLIGLE